MANRHLIEEEKELNIFDPDSFGTPSHPSHRSAVMDDPGQHQRPQVAGEIMPGQFMPSEDCFDLFIDFIESDEWLLPIESFIDYFCIVFPTQNSEEHKNEKMKVFQEYRSIVKLNLDNFLYEILNYTKEQLSNLLAEYEHHLKFEQMMHLLAVEDYLIFHDFMYEAYLASLKGGSAFQRRLNQGRMQGQPSANFNKPITEEELIEQAIRESMKSAGQTQTTPGTATGRMQSTTALSEEEQIALAIAASEQEEQKRTRAMQESEEELIKRAIAESQALEAAQQREEEEKMLAAIKESEATLAAEQRKLQLQQEEEERRLAAEIEAGKQKEAQAKLEKTTKRREAMEAKRRELQEQQQALEQKMAEGYQTEQRKLIEKEKEAKRLEMLGRLRAQALQEDKRLEALKGAREEEKVAPKVVAQEQRPHSKEFMKGFEKLNMKVSHNLPLDTLPSLQLNTIRADEANPMDEIEIDTASNSKQSNQESLEERRLRLEARRDAIQQKKRDEEEAKARANQQEERKRDGGDIFRNTQMKFNESPEQKKLRLKRALKALHSADIGKPSAFVGMQVGKPIQIEWNRGGRDLEILDADDEDNSGIQFQKVGRAIMDTDDF